MDSSGDIWKIIYLGFEKSQRSVTHDILHYTNILTYLLTKTCINFNLYAAYLISTYYYAAFVVLVLLIYPCIIMYCWLYILSKSY